MKVYVVSWSRFDKIIGIFGTKVAAEATARAKGTGHLVREFEVDSPIEGLLRRLVEKGCETPSGINDDPVCFFCEDRFVWVAKLDAFEERHAPDCPYDAAKALLGQA